MAEKLQQGDRFPSLTFKLVSGETIRIPEEMPSRYLAVLFYRGVWWPYCARQLAAYEEQKAELAGVECTVIAASVEPMEVVQEMKDKSGASFDFAYGITREDAELLGSWWSEDRGGYIQPSEFLLGRGGVVLGSMYASGPVGRMGADEALRQITNRERRRREEEGAGH